MEKDFQHLLEVIHHKYDVNFIFDFFEKYSDKSFVFVTKKLMEKSSHSDTKSMNDIILILAIVIGNCPDGDSEYNIYLKSIINSYNLFVNKNVLHTKDFTSDTENVYHIIYMFFDFFNTHPDIVDVLDEKEQNDFISNIVTITSLKYKKNDPTNFQVGIMYAVEVFNYFDKQKIKKYEKYFLNHFDSDVVTRFKERIE